MATQGTIVLKRRQDFCDHAPEALRICACQVHDLVAELEAANAENTLLRRIVSAYEGR